MFYLALQIWKKDSFMWKKKIFTEKLQHETLETASLNIASPVRTQVV